MKVLITGTTTGIGYHLMQHFIDLNYDIYTINRRNINIENVKVKNFICDLSDLTQVETLINNIKCLDIDILINNAGGGTASKLDDVTTDIIKKELTLNFISPYLLIKLFYPKLIKKDYSRIINISSISSKRGTPFLYTYSAAKSAIDSLTQSISATSAVFGFTINSICPGGIETEMSIEGRKKISTLKGLKEFEYQENMKKQMNLDTLISPSSIISLVDYLISEEANCITGQCINICGALEVK